MYIHTCIKQKDLLKNQIWRMRKRKIQWMTPNFRFKQGVRM